MQRHLEVHPVFDGVAYGPLITTYVAVNSDRDVRGSVPSDWQGIADEDELLLMPLGAYLVRDEKRTVMIDAGFGTRDSTPSSFTFKGGELMHSLARLGVTPEEVTDVFLTHLHYDHVGWCSSGGEAVFPNATYRCHAEDWNHFAGAASPDEATRERLLPLTSQFETWDRDGEPIEGFFVTHAPGHTPGSSIVRATAMTESICFLGDLAHHPIQLEKARWASMGDVDYIMAAQTREAVRHQLRSTGWYAAPAHFAGMRPGRLIADSAGDKWVPVRGQQSDEIDFGDFDAIETMTRQWADPKIDS